MFQSSHAWVKSKMKDITCPRVDKNENELIFSPIMKPHIRAVLIASLLSAMSLVAQNAPLPSEADSMLKQLEEFEQEKRALAEAAIAEKRHLVAKALQPHLERETKAGRLDVAMRLKAKIAELNGVVAQTNPVAVIGTTWKNGSWSYQFLSDGVVKVKAPTGENHYRWVQEDVKVIITAADGTEFATWRISRTGDGARVISGTGDGMEPKKQAAP